MHHCWRRNTTRLVKFKLVRVGENDLALEKFLGPNSGPVRMMKYLWEPIVTQTYCRSILFIRETWRYILSILTTVNPNSQLYFMIGFVANCEVLFDPFNKMNCHARYFLSMIVSVSDWKTRHNHVRITDCFHLPNKYKYIRLEHKHVLRLPLSPGNWTQYRLKQWQNSDSHHWWRHPVHISEFTVSSFGQWSQ